jgi:hypothetical protein
MTITFAHKKTKPEVVGIIDKAADNLFLNGIGATVRIVEPKKEWVESTMSFSLTGKMGFIAVPVSGTVVVDDVNVVAEFELPPMIKNFLGEDKVRGVVTGKMKELVGA